MNQQKCIGKIKTKRYYTRIQRTTKRHATQNQGLSRQLLQLDGPCHPHRIGRVWRLPGT
jgi:hypothetical protein